jgi:hypothetical protein
MEYRTTQGEITMSAYPKTLCITVNNEDEESAAVNSGFAESKQEFPKMLYLHPADKTKEHKYIVVATQEAMDEATGKGYQVEPHVIPPVDEFEEAPGSGSLRYEAGDWTHTTGEVVTDDVSPVEEV